MKKTKTQEAVEKKITAEKEKKYQERIDSIIALAKLLTQINLLQSELIKSDERIIKIYKDSAKRDAKIIIGLIIILGVALTALNYFLQY